VCIVRAPCSIEAPAAAWGFRRCICNNHGSAACGPLPRCSRY
jgi:hypothetical protein